MDATFCANCGNAQGEQCIQCQTINQSDAKFCAGCARPINWVCTICNSKNQAGAIFCATCGKEHHISFGEKLLKPQYIVVASIMILVAVFGISNNFWSVNSNEGNSYLNGNSNPNQTQSSKTSRSNTESNLKDYAFLNFNLSNEIDHDAKLTLDCPDGVYFSKSGSSSGSVSSYTKNISGTYKFTYSNTNYNDDGFMGLSSKKVKKFYTRSFYLDGKSEVYDIEISNLSNTVRIYPK